ncbi:methyltransferase, FkbM family [Solimonas aquatica]|uniref:Methyltransferase, FkbM family n=1 Tax=Solimonas aquatica TaxID=489703 RepID=A0A1H9BVP4_9GAMM|nr:FkbM family methyltransferase [Solimonas aquatica]SEP93046.1 methyltransferase, FkbM family [Solimonas aquatica]
MSRVNNRFDQGFRKGNPFSYDFMDQFLLFLAAKGFEPRLIFDIGAAKGHWARMARAAFPHAKIHMFEPIGAWKEELDRTCEEIGQANWSQVAVGSSPGFVEIEQHSITTQSLIPQGQFRSSHGVAKTDRVEVQTVDQVAQGSYGGCLDFLKVDVQGYELPVLEGAKEALNDCEVVLLECSLYKFFGEQTPLFLDIYQFMSACGFVLFDLPTLMRRSGDHALGQLDAVFVRHDSALRKTTSYVKPFGWQSIRPPDRRHGTLIFGNGFMSPQYDERREWRWASTPSCAHIVNETDSTLRLNFRCMVTVAGDHRVGDLSVSTNAHRQILLRECGSRAIPLSFIVSVPPHENIRLDFEGPENIQAYGRDLSFRLINYEITAAEQNSRMSA